MPETKDVEASGCSRPPSARRDRDRELINPMPQAVIEIRFDGSLLFANRQSRKLFGFGLDEDLAGTKNVFDHIDTADQKLVRTCIEFIRAGESVHPPEIRVLRRDGTTVPVMVFANLLVNGGEAPGISAVIAEITVQREMAGNVEEAEERYRALFSSTGTAMIIIEDDMSISLANEEFYRFSGYSPGERLTFSGLGLHEDGAFMAEIHRTRTAGEGSVQGSCEFRYVRRDGGVRDGLLTARLIPGTGRTVASIVDITDFKQAQRNIERHSESLKDARAALNVLLKRREQDRAHLEGTVRENLAQGVFPLLDRLKLHKHTAEVANIIAAMEENLHAIVSPFLPGITSACRGMTPREIEILVLVKEGRSTKEISRTLHTSERTIDYQRSSIRRKLGISNSKVNLRTYIKTHLDGR